MVAGLRLLIEPAGTTVSASVPPPAPKVHLEGAAPGSRLEVSEPLAPGVSTFGATPDGTSLPEAARAPAAHPELAPFEPVSVQLPGSGAANIDPVATGRDGNLGLPEDPSRMGWWTGGSRAGSPYGGVVVAGHIDSRSFGIGFAAKLADLQTGDRVVLTGGHQKLAYVVTERYLLPRDRVDRLVSLFSQRTKPRLVLLTCGGSYRPDLGYSDNLVVEAVPDGVPRSLS